MRFFIFTTALIFSLSCQNFLERSSNLAKNGKFLKFEPKEETKKEKIKLMTWNLNNLGKYTSEYRFQFFSSELFKNLLIAKMILDENPDIFIAQEVRSKEVAHYFAKKYLKGKYTPLHIETNEFHDTTFFIRNDFPYYIHYQSFAQITPGYKAFTRDVPTAFVFDGKDKKIPIFSVTGVHLKAYSGKKRREREKKVRRREVSNLISSLKKSSQFFNNFYPSMIVGDFNSSLNSNLMKELKSSVHHRSVFNVGDINQRSKVTFFNSKGGKKREADGVLISKEFSDKYIHDAQILSKKYYNPLILAYPSDHFPIVITFSIPRM